MNALGVFGGINIIDELPVIERLVAFQHSMKPDSIVTYGAGGAEHTARQWAHCYGLTVITINPPFGWRRDVAQVHGAAFQLCYGGIFFNGDYGGLAAAMMNAGYPVAMVRLPD